MNCIGPLARDIDDLALALSIIQGQDGHDYDVPPAPADGLPALLDVSLADIPLSFAASFPGLPVSADTRAAVERVASAVVSACGRVEERLPEEIDFEEMLTVRATLRRYVRAFTEPPSEPLPFDEYLRTLDRRDQFIRSWETFFGDGAFICPVMMTTAFRHCPRETPIPVDGVELPYADLAAYCRPFNLTGHPAVTIPVGLDRDELPIGVQIVGPLWSDSRLLAIAKAISALIGPIGRPPAG